MSDDLKKAIELAEIAKENIEPGGSTVTEQLQKSHVKSYSRTTVSGATVQVKEHDDSRQAKYDHPHVVGKISHHKIFGDGGRGEKEGNGDPTHHATTTIGFAGTDYHPIGKTGNSAHDDTPVEAFESEDGHRVWADKHGRVHADGKSEVNALREKYERSTKIANKGKMAGADTPDQPAKKKAEKPLPTNNESWGYHGEAYTAHEGHVNEQKKGAGADEHFALASKAVMKYGGVGAIDARNYLDSRSGRHLHDEVQNRVSRHEGVPKDADKGHHPDLIKKHIDSAIKEHFQQKWAKKNLAEVVKDREYFK